MNPFQHLKIFAKSTKSEKIAVPILTIEISEKEIMDYMLNPMVGFLGSISENDAITFYLRQISKILNGFCPDYSLGGTIKSILNQFDYDTCSKNFNNETCVYTFSFWKETKKKNFLKFFGKLLILYSKI